VGTLHYPAGGTAQIFASFRSPFNTHAGLIGTEGRLTFTEPFVGLDRGGVLIFTPPQGEPEVLTVGYQELYSGEIEDMHAAILDHVPTNVSLQESRDHIRTVRALLQSAQEGKPKRLD
jgi:predicted dehydrogenase